MSKDIRADQGLSPVFWLAHPYETGKIEDGSLVADLFLQYLLLHRSRLELNSWLKCRSCAEIAINKLSFAF